MCKQTKWIRFKALGGYKVKYNLGDAVKIKDLYDYDGNRVYGRIVELGKCGGFKVLHKDIEEPNHTINLWYESSELE